MRHQPNATAKSLSWTAGILYSIISLIEIYFPDLSVGISSALFRRFDLATNQALQVPIESFVSGLFFTMIFAWLAGYLFAGFYNYFARNSR